MDSAVVNISWEWQRKPKRQTVNKTMISDEILPRKTQSSDGKSGPLRVGFKPWRQWSNSGYQ